MEEKILIKSYSSKKMKLFFMGLGIAILILSVIILVSAIRLAKLNAARYLHYYMFSYSECDFCGKFVSDVSDNQISHILEFHSDKLYEYGLFSYDSTWFILHWLFLFLASILFFIYFSLSRCSITVTNKNISGRTFLGKKVVLPVHMVSAYSTSKIFSSVAISTSSGFIHFPCIGNYSEIANVLQQLLNERQQKTETQKDIISEQNNSKKLDDLIKLKNLLDAGIITQEEFDIKKKEILGL